VRDYREAFESPLDHALQTLGTDRRYISSLLEKGKSYRLILLINELEPDSENDEI